MYSSSAPICGTSGAACVRRCQIHCDREGWREQNQRKQEKEEQKKELTVRVSGYSLMLSEWSVKTGVKCCSAMKD